MFSPCSLSPLDIPFSDQDGIHSSTRHNTHMRNTHVMVERGPALAFLLRDIPGGCPDVTAGVWYGRRATTKKGGILLERENEGKVRSHDGRRHVALCISA